MVAAKILIVMAINESKIIRWRARAVTENVIMSHNEPKQRAMLRADM